MTTWTPKTQQAETWAAKTRQAEAWSEKSRQSEAWAAAAINRTRVFSPLVFSLWPVFATGVSSDFWTEKTKQPETWV